MTKVFIATPAYSGLVHAPYTMSLLTTCRLLSEANIDIHICIKTSGSLLVAERNSLIEAFWNSDCTHMLCIDSDLGWNPQQVPMLLSKNEDLIAGCYPSRVENSFIFRPVFNEQKQVTSNEKGLIEMEYTPAGFMLISRHAISMMRDRFPELKYEPKYEDNDPDKNKGYAFFNTEIWNGEFWGEDYYFCRKVREAGIKIWCDPTLQFDHAGKKGCLMEVLTLSKEQ